MHFPVTIHIAAVNILLHTITETFALLIGFRYFIFLQGRQGDTIVHQNRVWIIIAATLGAFIGSHLLGSFENPDEFVSSKNMLLYFYSNKTVVGGFLGGLFCVEFAKKMMSEKQASGDLFVPPILLSLIIGRIGCFSMGIYENTYGKETLLPWGINLGDGKLRHPVSIYEIIFLLGLWVSLISIQKKYILQQGALFKIFMIAYLIFRLLLDFIKPHVSVIASLSIIQLTCVAGLIYYYRYFLHPSKLISNNIR